LCVLLLLVRDVSAVLTIFWLTGRSIPRPRVLAPVELVTKISHLTVLLTMSTLAMAPHLSIILFLMQLFHNLITFRKFSVFRRKVTVAVFAVAI